MTERRMIDPAWLEGATLDKDGNLLSAPFDDDEAYLAWAIYAQVRDLCRAHGGNPPTDPLRACLWAALQWRRINAEAQVIMRDEGGETSH